MLNASTSEADLYYLFDGLGSVAATTDASGNLVKRYSYEPYGQEISPASGDPNPWRYASGYFDKSTGMLKFGTRYYMPDVMRWTQRDPVRGMPANPMSLNAYLYSSCNPINLTDPSGRIPICSIIPDVHIETNPAYTACVDQCDADFAACMDEGSNPFDWEICFIRWQACLVNCQALYPPVLIRLEWC
jgi:RHS repeat-associated protein